MSYPAGATLVHTSPTAFVWERGYYTYRYKSRHIYIYYTFKYTTYKSVFSYLLVSLTLPQFLYLNFCHNIKHKKSRGPSGLLDFVLCALLALRLCDPRSGAMIG